MANLIRTCTTVLFLTALTLSTGVRADFEFHVEGWYGHLFASDSGQFSSCVMSTYNDSNYLLLLKLQRDKNFTVGVGNYSWQEIPGGGANMKILFAPKLKFEGKAIAVSRNVFAMIAPNSKEAFQALHSSQKAWALLKKKLIGFEIAGIDKALDLLQECVRHGVSAHS